MDLKSRRRAVWFVLFWGVSAGAMSFGQENSVAKKDDGPANVRALLEKWQASGGLPEGVVVHVFACLGAGAADTRPVEIRERWEFSSKQVRQYIREFQDPTQRKERDANEELQEDGERVAVRPFRSQDICKWLLDGKAIEIQARKGTGPELAFVGTNYGLGTRSIRVTQNGKAILELYETRAAFRRLYRESDAIAFAKLYEQLSGRARELFNAKTDASK